jgi:hypothetical protein
LEVFCVIPNGNMQLDSEVFTATCVRCNTTIQSLNSDDFQQCACKRIAIDGGLNMNERRYIGSHFDFKFGQHPSPTRNPTRRPQRQDSPTTQDRGGGNKEKVLLYMASIST